jgi:hypothetical protein
MSTVKVSRRAIDRRAEEHPTMESWLALTVSDPLRLTGFMEGEPAVMALTAKAVGGGLGVGYYGQGEMLVRKAPVRQQTEASRLLKAVGARHLLAFGTDGIERSFSTQYALPLRHRDWLFMMTGGPPEETAFVARVAAKLKRTGGVGTDPITRAEASLCVVMAALSGGGVLERRGPTHGPLVDALKRAIADLAALGGSQDPLSLALCLHTRGVSLGLAAGRPLYLGVRPIPTAPGGRSDPMRAVVLTDQPTSVPAEAIGPWEGVLVSDECRTFRFPLN